MKLIAKVKTLGEIKMLRTKSRNVQAQFLSFQASTVNSLAEDFILQTIHNRMRDFGYSERIVQGTIVSGVNILSKRKFRIFFRSELFGENGFDVALARERDGTKSHFVAPVKKKALHFDGKFSKGHQVSGIIPSHIIERTLDEIAEPFFDEYTRIERDWLKANFGGLVEIAI